MLENSIMFNRNIISYLEKWQKKKSRKPLIIRGARQVGKTSAVRIFAKHNFSNFIEINLENPEIIELFREVKTLKDFEQIVELGLKKRLIPGKTLLFLDEIQNFPELIKLLRFFYEKMPALHVIASGSLLETQIEKFGFNMPVGRVEYVYLYPLTFFEFLEAKGEEEILTILKKSNLNQKISQPVHRLARNLFYQYVFLGGMPEVISLFIKKVPLAELNSVYNSLLTGYEEDLYKYGKKSEIKYLQYVLSQAPYFAGERITYEKFGGASFRSREMKNAFSLLAKAMILTQIKATKSTAPPLLAQEKRPKKLLFLDVGLVNFKNKIQINFLKTKNLADFYRGKIAEQVVGQNLLANNLGQKQELYYWAKEKTRGAAEVDFCLMSGGKIVGIEVKSGHSLKLKSLFSFSRAVENNKIIRVYDGELKQENIIYAGQKYKLISVPFYLANRILEIEV